MVDVVFELAFVYNAIDLLANSLNPAVSTDLANDVLIEPALTKLKFLVDRLRAICNDILELQRSELSPLLFHRTQSYTRGSFLRTTLWFCTCHNGFSADPVFHKGPRQFLLVS